MNVNNVLSIKDNFCFELLTNVVLAFWFFLEQHKTFSAGISAFSENDSFLWNALKVT